METQNGQTPKQSNHPQNTTPPINNHTVMAALSYLGPLVIVSYLTSKDNPFVKFHIKQGLVIFCIEIIVWIISSMMPSFFMILNIVNLATLILSIVGIVNVVQGHEKELPFVGGLSKNFKF